MSGPRPATRAVHAGYEPDAVTGAIMPPVFLTSTYVQDEPGKPRNGYEYSRSQNPTRYALQDAINELEGGVAAYTYSSGMAAITGLLLTLKPGDRIVAGNDLYGGTFRLFNKIATRFGLVFEYRDTSRPGALEGLPDDTRIVYVETPSNPLMRITSIADAVAAARGVGAEVAVDNTFATPILQRPMDFGVDYVIHSTTKYIGGHSDVVGGALVVADAARGEDVWFHQNSAGLSNSPMDAFLTLRGLRTLAVRMERHCENAMRLAEFLEARSDVERVHYPGLTSHAGHAVAARQMSGFGGMVSFELPGGEPAARRLVGVMRVFQLAESLGGVESLIELPAPMTHASIPAEERRKAGLVDGLVRLSVGIEDVDDLLEDLERGLVEAGPT